MRHDCKCCFGIAVLLLLSSSARSATLEGVVRDESGQPIAGARVGIATAAPLKGPAMFCPSCYLDCAKSTRTDSAGHFEIPSVSDSLKFQVLFTAPGHKSQITKLINPATSDLDIKLAATPPDGHPERTIRAQVCDDLGHPIEGALVAACGAKTPSKRWYGSVENVEPTVCDAEGRFSLVLPADFEAIDLELTANGKAGLQLLELKPGGEEKKLTIPTGTRVTGRVLRAGKPFVGLGLAVCQLDRTTQNLFIKAVACTTDRDGRFDFNYLPADQRYAIFTLVGEGATSNRDSVLSTKVFSAKSNNQTRDLGDLKSQPGVHIQGRVEFPSGEKVPENAKLSLHRDPAWDLIAVPVAEDGTFKIDGVPPEAYEISVNSKQFQIDGSRVNFQLRGPQSLGIYVAKSVDDLVIPLMAK